MEPKGAMSAPDRILESTIPAVSQSASSVLWSVLLHVVVVPVAVVLWPESPGVPRAGSQAPAAIEVSIVDAADFRDMKGHARQPRVGLEAAPVLPSVPRDVENSESATVSQLARLSQESLERPAADPKIFSRHVEGRLRDTHQTANETGHSVSGRGSSVRQAAAADTKAVPEPRRRPQPLISHETHGLGNGIGATTTRSNTVLAGAVTPNDAPRNIAPPQVVPTHRVDGQGDGAARGPIDTGAMTGLAEASDALPRVLDAPPPVYPRHARRRGLEGRVVLRVVVGRDGMPREIDVQNTSGHAILDAAARDAVATWRFAPGSYARHRVDIPVSFRLDREGR